MGEVYVKILHDHNGEYEPQIIEKHSRNADGIAEKILASYSCGMNQRDISKQIKNLYNVASIFLAPDVDRRESCLHYGTEQISKQINVLGRILLPLANIFYDFINFIMKSIYFLKNY